MRPLPVPSLHRRALGRGLNWRVGSMLARASFAGEPWPQKRKQSVTGANRYAELVGEA